MLLKVMTYNICRARWQGPRTIARVIADSQADLVALNEITRWYPLDLLRHQPNYLAQVLRRLTGQSWHAYFGPAAGPTFGNALLTTWPVLKIENFPLPRYNNHEKRACLAATIKAGRNTCVVFVTHIHPGTEKMAQIHAVFALARQFSGPKILLGDFNDGNFVKPAIIDPFFDAFTVKNSGAGPTYPADKPQYRIDYIFAEGLTVKSCHVLDNEVTRKASDHLPLWSELILRENLPGPTATTPAPPQQPKA